MAMTKEEREKLEKLPASDLVEMLDKLRDENEKNSKEAVKEREKVMREFFNKTNQTEEEAAKDEPAKDWRKSKPFQRLKNKFK